MSKPFILVFFKKLTISLSEEFLRSKSLGEKIAEIFMISIALFLGTVSIGTLLLAWITYWNEPFFYFFIDIMLVCITVLIIAPWLLERDRKGSLKKESLIQLSIVIGSMGIFIFLTSIILLFDLKSRMAGTAFIFISLGYILAGALIFSEARVKNTANSGNQ